MSGYDHGMAQIADRSESQVLNMLCAGVESKRQKKALGS
jgi:hypothetical protein